ncbi:hypothetical protein J7E50_08340 [Pedobacter sp. ISL-68]|uniref:sporulation initiation factor Spo0A C-terminal domain-containing protein n=1 Tax=unclassified Pedobacter TaxID=2628915 RepID=UPI001BE67449|nr:MULTISPECIES: sporulation initiation factor Spo0A C-terminal domain-containing protein [unclassified Pedobacter]MBT2560842.1 hypothetical protein [Pedobacter sp. ISL-64]MBT2590221.1 hypothetical protein [Pedobacter sp. ISL-68]
MDLKKLKEFREQLGISSPEKVSNMLIALIEYTIRTEAILDSILKNQVDIVAAINSKDPSEVNKEFNEHIEDVYNKTKADVADFVLPV